MRMTLISPERRFGRRLSGTSIPIINKAHKRSCEIEPGNQPPKPQNARGATVNGNCTARAAFPVYWAMRFTV